VRIVGYLKRNHLLIC